jgi:ribosomal protein S18 acetylase RimI-like enzyme
MEIFPFREEFLNDAAELFVTNYRKQRQAVPVLPDALENVHRVAGMLNELFQTCPGVAAIENGQLTGYMGWYIADHFRDADITGAFCPVWAHSVANKATAAVYRGMHRTASAYWATRGCGVHVISLLATDSSALKTWFWNGFGLAVVDAIRPVLPLNARLAEHLVVRKAQSQDAELIAILESEHRRHYSEPPIFMAAQEPAAPQDLREFIGAPNNTIWLAEFQGEPAGMMRFEARTFGATDIVQSETTISISGAYTRSQYRGKGAAAAVLDAALHYYGERGFERCSVDFESFNPEAANFWMKYFEPVTFSLMRHPEALQQVRIV